MADTPKENKTETKEKSKEQNKQVSYDIQLSIPSIIAALHQKAIGSAEKKAQNIRIANSAIESDGKTAKLKSAGQHIVSVLSTNEGEKVKKQDAIVALQEYVNWFVGPDLGKKVTDKVVLPLGNGEDDKNVSNSDNQDEKNDEDVKNNDQDKQVSNDEANKESDDESQEQENKEEPKQLGDSIKIKSFGEFLIENCGLKFLLEDNDEANKESDDESQEQENKEEKDDKNPEALGWYIAYNLKVQGLKETPLKDAMKQFATSFFDNLTITASGLFGSGKSFTGKDIRKGLHDLKHINHEKLAEEVDKYIKKKFPKIEQSEVQARDKNTLLKEIKNQGNLTPEEKEAINNAEYSLTIQIKEKDPKKPFINKQKIADVIRKCISFFRIGKKAKITKDSIIVIEDYEDPKKNDDYRNSNKLPSISELKNIMNSFFKDDKEEIEVKINGPELIELLEKKFKITDKKALSDSNVKDILKMYEDFRKNLENKSDDDFITKKEFEDFIQKYGTLRNSKKIKVESSSFSFINREDIASKILDMLFEDQIDLEPQQVLEADDENKSRQNQEKSDIKSEKCSKTIEELKKQWKEIVRKYVKEQKCKITIIEKDDAMKQLQYEDLSQIESEFNKNNELNYCIAIDFDTNSKLSESTISEKLFDMIFENHIDFSVDKLREIMKKLNNKELDLPEGIDTNEDLKNALFAGIVKYENNKLIKIDDKEIIQNIDTKQLENQVNKTEDSIEEIEEKTNDDLSKAFEEFKNFAEVSDNNYGKMVILEKEVVTNESIIDDCYNQLLLEKSIYSDTGRKKKKDVINEIKRVGVKTIKDNKNNLMKNFQTQQKKGIESAKDKKEEQRLKNIFSEIQKFFDQLFNCESTDDMVSLVEKEFDDEKTIGRTTQIWRVFDRAHLPDEEKNDNEYNEKVKISWYDSDPESGNKEDKPMKELEIDKGTSINSSDEARQTFEELNKKLQDKKKEGFEFDGWSPEPNTKVEKDTEVISKYISSDRKEEIKSYAVSFSYLSDPIDANSELKVIEVDGEPIQAVKDGDKAKRPDEKSIPTINGYEFKDWGDAEGKLDSVKEDIDAIANFQPIGGIVPVEENKIKVKAYLMPFAYYENSDPGEEIEITFVAPKDPESPDGETTEIEKVKGKLGNINTPDDKVPQKEGYEFEKWDKDPQQIKEDGQTIKAIYKKKDDTDNNKENVEKVDQEIDSSNRGNYLYIYPIESSKDFEEGTSVKEDK